MNKAVFLQTFLKALQPSALISMVVFAIIMPLIFGLAAEGPDAATAISPLISGPFLPMVIAYSFVRESVANTRSMNDGEYLSLLFTRPITRMSYIVTKWLAGSVMVCAIVMVQLSLYSAVRLLMGSTETAFSNPYAVVNAVLNSFSYTALIVFIASFPMKLGVWLFIVLIYSSMLGTGITNYVFRSAEGSSLFIQIILNFFQFVQQFTAPGIDTYDTFNAQVFSIWPFVCYASNITLYLFCATAILNKREFFYASE